MTLHPLLPELATLGKAPIWDSADKEKELMKTGTVLVGLVYDGGVLVAGDTQGTLGHIPNNI